MRKLIAAINMSVDGFCDHTAFMPDDELMEYFNNLMRSADTLVYGRTTYQLMESYWPALVTDPSGNRGNDEFAVLMDNISKIVYSRTLNTVVWKNSILKKEIVTEELLELKRQTGKDILVGSPSLIASLTERNVIDEYQLTVHPGILGHGLPLFKNLTHRVDLALIKTKTYHCGAITLFYESTKERKQLPTG